MSTQVDTTVECLMNCVSDRTIGMTEETCRILAQEVDVLVTIGIPQVNTFSSHHRQWERFIVQGRTSVATRENSAGFKVFREAIRIPFGVLSLRLLKGDFGISVIHKQ